MNRAYVSPLVVLCFLFSLFLFAGAAGATEKPSEVATAAKIDEHLGKTVDLTLEFTDEGGARRQLKDFIIPGRPVVFVPVYFRCPRLCSLVLNGLRDAVNESELELGTDYSIVSFSINPKETPALARKKKNSYMQTLDNPQGGEGAWHFLTGTQENILALTDQLGFGFALDKGEFIHSAAIMVLTEKGVLSRYLYGVSFPARDFRWALVEASKGRIGETFDKILLYCFRFDDAHGKYTLSILRVTKVVSLGVVVVLATWVVALYRREQKGTRK